MTPILFPAGTAPGGFTTHGLGNLADAASFRVTEQLNSAYVAEMKVPVDAVRYPDLTLGTLVLAKANPDDDPQPFRVTKFSRPVRGLVTVQLQHYCYDLAGYPVTGFTASTARTAVAAINSHMEVPCPITLSTDLSVTRTMEVIKPTQAWTLMGDQSGQLLSLYGGEWRYDGAAARLLTRRGADRGFSVRYGKNLIDLTQEESMAEVYSAVIPFWAGSDGTVVRGNAVQSPATPEITRVLPLDLSSRFQEQPTVSELDQAAAEWITKNDPWTPRVNLKVKFAQIAEGMEPGRPAGLDDVRLGDTVHVYFERLGVDTTARVIETVYDTLRERFESIKIGTPKQTVADTVVETKRTAAGAASLADSASKSAADNAAAIAAFQRELAEGAVTANTLNCQYLNIIPSQGLGFITIGGGGSPVGYNCHLTTVSLKDANDNIVTITYLGY